ncbi:MAG TPA: aminotransferase class I/II-fold pyridoxal phosphate-dependent enzyme, partial [Pseudonocardia sp.]
MLDFAVNVQGDAPPRWLRDRLVAALDDLARYPTAAADARARAAAAARHGRRPEEVLPLAGSAEGFALLPALRPRLAAVVHPGFTEPEAALRAGGVPVVRVLTEEADGHRLRPDRVPDAADLVVVGNPTNPT